MMAISLMVLLPLIALSMSTHQTLYCLLNLEAAMLSLIVLIFTTSYFSPLNASMILTIFTMAACEASLALACLVWMMRGAGNDLINSLLPHKL